VAWTEAHHLKPWCEGGRTDLANMVLLCGNDHRRIHDPNYRYERLPDGRIRFTRRT
jgi:predicted HNH restriction endonuclease